MKSLAALALTALLVASGCNATTSEEAVTNDSALEGDAACAAEAARFDTQLARIPHATYDAVMETKTACGTRFHTVGPTHVDEHRLVRVGSMTKSFVSVVTLQLVAEGKVKLDDRLDLYLPDVPSFAAGVTVRQILQHTSGLFNYTETPEFWTALSAHPEQPISVDQILALSARPAYFAAGGGWHYSNTNYILAGLLVEKVDERPKWTMEVMRSPACACSRPSVVSRRKAYSRSVTRPEEERTRRSRSSFASSRRAYSRPRSRMASE
jgi:CubicO group peptidase (beta-lactamase class C family)